MTRSPRKSGPVPPCDAEPSIELTSGHAASGNARVAGLERRDRRLPLWWQWRWHGSWANSKSSTKWP